ncbi:MAG: hypothetical protein GY699_22835 [Desulfobacteraceae bacterium]|nr:hypothetical protein [Desulfobacteraceae bacterium]
MCFKKTFSILLMIVLFGAYPVFLSDKYTVTRPINENSSEKDSSSKLIDKDVLEDKEKNYIFFSYLLSDDAKEFIVIFFDLPISFYFIKFLINSSRNPRLPPI